MNKVLKKAVSLVIAVALAIAVLPAMSLASAAEIGETTTFVFNPKLINKSELTGKEDSSVNISAPDGETQNPLYDYLKVGESEYAPNYYRNWKLFAYNTSSTASIDATNGMQIQYARATNKHYFAIKVKGFEEGIYNVKLDALPLDGGIVGLYVLDNAVYGNKTIAEITALMENPSGNDGVRKIGEADFYGRAGTAGVLYDTAYRTTTDPDYAPYASGSAVAELGNVTFSGTAEDEHIVVIRYEGQGVLEGTETSGNTNGRRLSIRALSFTKTTEAKKKGTFGDYAAFIEETNEGISSLYLISAIDSLNYAKVGFDLSTDGGVTWENLETTEAYEAINTSGIQGDESKNPTTATTLTYDSGKFGLDSGFVYVVSKNIGSFTGQTVQFKPFAIKGDTKIEGSTYQVTLKK